MRKRQGGILTFLHFSNYAACRITGGLPAQLAREVSPQRGCLPSPDPAWTPEAVGAAATPTPPDPAAPDPGSAPAPEPMRPAHCWVASGLWEAEPRVVGLQLGDRIPAYKS